MKLMNRLRVLALAALVVLSGPEDSRAEKEPLSPRELQATATHVVIGKVGAIYSRREQNGNYEYTRYAAEVRVQKAEKGEAPGELIYVRFVDIAWRGKGPPPPGPSGHSPQPQVGGVYRFYLARNAYDGLTEGNKDGGYNVVYGNGVQVLNQ